jgi:hypothetical protein
MLQIPPPPFPRAPAGLGSTTWSRRCGNPVWGDDFDCNCCSILYTAYYSSRRVKSYACRPCTPWHDATKRAKHDAMTIHKLMRCCLGIHCHINDHSVPKRPCQQRPCLPCGTPPDWLSAPPRCWNSHTGRQVPCGRCQHQLCRLYRVTLHDAPTTHREAQQVKVRQVWPQWQRQQA